MEILGPDHYKPTVSVGIGPVKATFTLDVVMTTKQEPTHAEATARGNAAGTAVEMQGGMDLTELSATATAMRWIANVNVSGKIASLGARLMESTANKLTARFFDCTRQKLEEQAGVTAPSLTPEAGTE
jgi:carbon monoxide dehydrogenase subunit G